MVWYLFGTHGVLHVWHSVLHWYGVTMVVLHWFGVSLVFRVTLI